MCTKFVHIEIQYFSHLLVNVRPILCLCLASHRALLDEAEVQRLHCNQKSLIRYTNYAFFQFHVFCICFDKLK